MPKQRAEGRLTEGVEVALNAEELDMDTAAMQAKYEETMREQQSQLQKEDLSDMVAEHAAKQSKVWAIYLKKPSLAEPEWRKGRANDSGFLVRNSFVPNDFFP